MLYITNNGDIITSRDRIVTGVNEKGFAVTTNIVASFCADKMIPGRFKKALFAISDMEGIPVSDIARDINVRPSYLLQLMDDDRFIPRAILADLNENYQLNINYLYKKNDNSVWTDEPTT